jgi:hypothetical protein
MKKRKGFLPLKALGKRVAIRFDDHSIGDSTRTVCEVQGIVDKLNESEILLRWWTVFSPDTTVAEISDDNHEICRIVQGTVIQWAITEPKKWKDA